MGSLPTLLIPYASHDMMMIALWQKAVCSAWGCLCGQSTYFAHTLCLTRHDDDCIVGKGSACIHTFTDCMQKDMPTCLGNALAQVNG